MPYFPTIGLLKLIENTTGVFPVPLLALVESAFGERLGTTNAGELTASHRENSVSA